MEKGKSQAGNRLAQVYLEGWPLSQLVCEKGKGAVVHIGP